LSASTRSEGSSWPYRTVCAPTAILLCASRRARSTARACSISSRSGDRASTSAASSRSSSRAHKRIHSGTVTMRIVSVSGNGSAVTAET
jgi:hypothetical protein